MDKNEINRLRRMAYGYLAGRGWNHETAEDFAQYYLLKVLLEERKTSMENIAIDFLRLNYGDYRTGTGYAKAKARLVGDYTHEEAYGFDLNLAAKPSVVETGVNLMPYLTMREAMVLLYSQQGFNQRVIAEILGVTDGRISQILKAIRRKTSDVNELAELWDEYRLSPKKEFQIDWVCL